MNLTQNRPRSFFARSRLVAVAGLAVGLMLAGLAPAHAAKKGDGSSTPAVRFDVSPPLTDLTPAPPPAPDKKKEKEPKKGLPVPAASAHDPVIQSSPGTASAPALGVGFEGIGGGLPGPTTGMYAPPDPNGAVGATQYAEVVNTDFAVFDKSGSLVYGPVATNTIWSGFGGGCQANNDGDATVKYDQLANRWIVQQFSVTSPYPYAECIAVSTTSDATGSWARYEFQGFGSNFPDYPKLSVWPDAYYVSYNLFRNGSTFAGPEVCAYDRAKMLAGQAATQQCQALSTSYGGLLAADVDGSTPPPAGAPNDVLSSGTNVLQLWKFHVDWTTPTNSTLTGPTSIPVASFSPACSGGGTCIPQAGTTNQLDSLADRLMYRVAYRNFGDHQSLVVDHAVVAGSSVGMRWYELRDPNGTPTVYQQGTYAPDANYRWMGSIAMDKKGDIAMGYSVSSSSMNPGIRYTGRLAGDLPLGTMTLGEGTIVAGTGSQTGTLHRWGDYTSMAVDPTDDCTFWYTNECLTANGSFNWHTHVGTFTLPGCLAPTAPAAPTNLAATAGDTQIGLTWSPSSGATSYNVKRGASGGPYTTIATGVTSTNYTDTGLTNGTTYSYVVSAENTAGESLDSNEASATPQPPPPAPPAPTSLTATPGNARVSLSWSGSPDATSYNVKRAAVAGGPYTTVATGVTSTSYTDTGLANGTTYYYVVSGVNAGGESPNSNEASATPLAPDFTLSVTPASRSVTRGNSTSYGIAITRLNGFTGSVSLSVSGLPARTSSSFSPNPASTTSTLTVSTRWKTSPGTYPLTIRGTNGALSHTASVVTLVVTVT